MEVIFKTIKTVGGYYVYDRSNNCIIKLSKEELNKIATRWPAEAVA